MEIWRKKLIDPMEKRLVGHLLAAIAADREGRNSVPVDTVRGVIMSFVQVCIVFVVRSLSNFTYNPFKMLSLLGVRIFLKHNKGG